MTPPRQRVSKGRRPFFMKDPDVDRLLAMVAALSAEVSVLRDRVDTAERLCEQGLPASPQNIEAYDAPPDVEAAREASRVAMLGRIFRILAPASEADVTETMYQGVVEEIS